MHAYQVLWLLPVLYGGKLRRPDHSPRSDFSSIVNEPPTRHAMAWPSPVHCGGRNSEMPVAPGANSQRRVGRDMQNTTDFARQTVNLPVRPLMATAPTTRAPMRPPSVSRPAPMVRSTTCAFRILAPRYMARLNVVPQTRSVKRFT